MITNKEQTVCRNFALGKKVLAMLKTRCYYSEVAKQEGKTPPGSAQADGLHEYLF
jgi:hypothetical protein